MFLVLIIAISALLAVISWWYYEYYKHSSYLYKYNGPTPIPIIGNAFSIGSSTDIIPVLMSYFKKYGPVIKMWIGFYPRLVIADHRVAKLIFDSTTILDKGYEYRFFEPWIGTGLLTGKGAKWRTHRKLLTPTFHSDILQGFIEIFHTQGNILIKKLNEQKSAGPVEIYELVRLCALDILYESVMGVQIHAQSKPESGYLKSVVEMNRIITVRTFSGLKSYDWYYKLTNDYKSEKRVTTTMSRHTISVIESREKELSICKNSAGDTNGFKTNKRLAFMDLLLKCREDGYLLTTEEVREEVETFMAGGHDPPTSAITFTLYCLARHQAVQEKAFEEVRNMFDNHRNKMPSMQDLDSLKYLEMVIKESTRVFPPIPMIVRELSTDTEFDGVMMPKGTTLSISIYGLHRQEEVFPEPDKFDPERFSPENSAKIPSSSHVPFSAGLRGCIGRRFATLAVKTVISKILMHYELIPVEGFEVVVKDESVLRPDNGVLIKLKERKLN